MSSRIFLDVELKQLDKLDKLSRAICRFEKLKNKVDSMIFDLSFDKHFKLDEQYILYCGQFVSFKKVVSSGVFDFFDKEA